MTQNPFRLVFEVLKYAVKYGHPKQRSAFTYCEDDLPSRIDSGKSKYGGPFTTEQVEDVKTFLRILVVCLAGSVSYAMTSTVLGIKQRLSAQLKGGPETMTVLEPLRRSWVIVIPLYELIFYPLFGKHLSTVSIAKKFLLGVLLSIASTVALLVLETVARHNYFDHYVNSTSETQCVFYQETNNVWKLSLDYRWMGIPDLLFSLSITLLGIGATEFVVAQSPYSMRGLMVGSAYGMYSLFAALSIAVSVPFTRRLSPWTWGTGVLSCSFWYTLLLLIIEIIVYIVLVVMEKFYKKRKREDVLPNEHIFAERYYEKLP